MKRQFLNWLDHKEENNDISRKQADKALSLLNEIIENEESNYELICYRLGKLNSIDMEFCNENEIIEFIINENSYSVHKIIKY